MHRPGITILPGTEHTHTKISIKINSRNATNICRKTNGIEESPVRAIIIIIIDSGKNDQWTKTNKFE